MMASGPELSLTARTARGAGWVMGWRFATRILGTISTLMLVRLLLPADFGLVALGTTFAQALDGLAELGIENALVREDHLDRDMYDTGFTFAAIRGSVSAILIIGCAWPISRFLGDPRLAGVLFALAAGVFISGIENIGIVDFQRNIAFDKEFNLLLGPRILGIVVCVTVAYTMRTYWALVAGILTTRCTRAICTYLMHEYRPRLSLRAWRRIIVFSFWSWMLGWVSLIKEGVDNFVIGRLLGTAPVGQFIMARDVGSMASTELVVPFCRALLPGLSQVRGRGADVADAYFRAVSVTLTVALPASIGIALVADPLIRLVIGPRWLAAVPLLQLFALAGLFRVVTYIGATLLTVYGMLQVQFHGSWASLLIRLVLMIVLIDRFGLLGSGFAVAAVAVLEETFYLIVTFRRFNLRPQRLLATNLRPAIAVVAMTAAVLLIKFSLGPAVTFPYFFAQVIAGAVTYTVTLLGGWQLAGRPAGAEAQIIALLGEATRSFSRRWRPER